LLSNINRRFPLYISEKGSKGSRTLEGSIVSGNSERFADLESFDELVITDVLSDTKAFVNIC
jgi:hypothetical protein